jgi:hypothetical protein
VERKVEGHIENFGIPLFGHCERHEVSALFCLGMLAYAVSLMHRAELGYIYVSSNISVIILP